MAAFAHRRILITRPAHQAEEMAGRLRALGAEVVHIPVLRILPPRSYEPLDRALRQLGAYRWVVFTSQNGVWAVEARLHHLRIPPEVLRSTRTAAIGPATARLLERLGAPPVLRPAEYRAEALVQAFSAYDLRGARILIPRAEEARDVLPQGLRVQGAEVEVVAAYRTGIAWEQAPRLLEALQGGVDAVTLTSPSAVRALWHFLAGRGLPEGVRVVCIGPVTAEAARRLGVRVDAVAEVYTSEGMVQALEALFEGRR